MQTIKNINKILIFFLISHVIIWTLIPSISNNNLPLDTIEALAWSSNLDWGYIKHPPLSAWFVEIFYRIFGNQDWSYYLLSQIFLVLTFFVIFRFSEDFLKNKTYGLISILLLEGIYFYNFTTPEFNVNVCQLPFWALTVYYCWKGIKQNDNLSWLMFGFFAALGVLSKYLFFYLLFSLDILIIYLIINKKLGYKFLFSLISFILVLLPHIFWLIENDYVTLTYALHRTGIEDTNFLSSHLMNPVIFLGKQIGILIPFFVMLLCIVSKFKIKFKFKETKLLFLIASSILPIILILLTSFLLGMKIRTMWMTPFYLFMGVFFVYIFQNKIILKKIKYFFSIFLIFFILSPITYFYISATKTNKRTDYPGKKIAKIVQKKWDNNFKNKIVIVGGDEWHAGNLSYHLQSRPRWDNIFQNKKNNLFNENDGFVLIGNSDILIKICETKFFEVENQGVCMIGQYK
jgi:4-amino-4-deoxy-L-arabinose transferase-like glycosyltransferase